MTKEDMTKIVEKRILKKMVNSRNLRLKEVYE